MLFFFVVVFILKKQYFSTISNRRMSSIGTGVSRHNFTRRVLSMGLHFFSTIYHRLHFLRTVESSKSNTLRRQLKVAGTDVETKKRSDSQRRTRFSTAIAVKGKDGVVFGVEKLIVSKLHEPTANRRIFNVDHHVGMVRVFAPSLCKISKILFSQGNVWFNSRRSRGTSKLKYVLNFWSLSFQVADRARKECVDYQSFYGSPIPAKVIN